LVYWAALVCACRWNLHDLLERRFLESWRMCTGNGAALVSVFLGAMLVGRVAGSRLARALPADRLILRR